MSKKKNNKALGNVSSFLLFVFPTFFIWTTVVMIPFLFGVGITFTDWNGLSMDINLVGLQNYQSVFTDPDFFDSFVKTIVYVVFSVVFSNLLGFLLALMLTTKIKGQNWFRTGFFTPNVIGGIILGYIWQFFFSYGLTSVGKRFGISWLSTSWLTDTNKALAALILVTVWQLSGYLMVIYIAGLSNVPAELIEAASIDGANGFQVIRHIKIPLISNSITICTFLAIVRTFMSFDLNLSLTAGGPYRSTELIAYKIYQTAFTKMDYGVGQAQAVVLFVIVAIISLVQVYFTRKAGGSSEEK